MATPVVQMPRSSPACGACFCGAVCRHGARECEWVALAVGVRDVELVEDDVGLADTSAVGVAKSHRVRMDQRPVAPDALGGVRPPTTYAIVSLLNLGRLGSVPT